MLEADSPVNRGHLLGPNIRHASFPRQKAPYPVTSCGLRSALVAEPLSRPLLLEWHSLRGAARYRHRTDGIEYGGQCPMSWEYPIHTMPRVA